ncbi:MAG TPA: hypothetical protein VMM57_01660 [Bacteroidota bacterium]|nr:hypothetical protein [Bacteroidota bacterium]
MKRSILYGFTVLAIAVCSSGCSKNSSSPTSSTGTAPGIPSVTFVGPTTTSTDTYAELTTSYALSANAYSSAFFAGFAAGSAKDNGGVWTWTVTANGVTVTFTATKQSDGSYAWKWSVNGTETGSGVTYNNWTFLNGTSSADGKSGEWKVYNDNATTLAADYVWAAGVNGSVTSETGTLSTYDATGSSVTAKLIVINRSDKTGEVDVYNNAVLVFKATWVANGSGQWTVYNSEGTQTGTGSWS